MKFKRDRMHQKRFLHMKLVSMLLIMSLLAGACGQKTSTQVKSDAVFMKSQGSELKLDKAMLQSVDASNALGVEMFKKMAQADKDKNQLLSPMSLMFALSMLQNGAEGTTRIELLVAMGEQEQGLNERYNHLVDYMNQFDGKAVTLKTANSLWVRKGLSIKETFVDTLKKYYDAEVFISDFNGEKALDDMNKWVEEKTNSLLKETIKEIKPETIAYLMNTVYFKGTWRDEFSADMTSREPFHMDDGNEKTVDMMYKVASLAYRESEKWQAVSLPYYGDCSMVVILPKGEIDSLIEGFSSEEINAMLSIGYKDYKRVALKLPKLDYEVSNQLSDVLKELGIEKAFSRHEADFSQMAELEGENIFVGSIFQNTRIILDEKGTEAAAVTVVELETGSAAIEAEPIEMTCDKPFMYLIKEDKTNAVLFMGIARRP